MKNFSSKPIIVEKTAQEIYEKFSDFNNFKGALPTDKVEKFECTANECTLSIKGAPEITLYMKEAIPWQKITFATKDNKPLEINFSFNIRAITDNSSELLLSINTQIDGFLSMMLSKPLQNLVDGMADKIIKKSYN